MHHIHAANYGKWDWASVYWALWLGVGFLPFELWALFTGRNHETLSDNVWRLAGLNNGSPWSFAHFLIAAFMVWLLFHFVFGAFR